MKISLAILVVHNEIIANHNEFRLWGILFSSSRIKAFYTHTCNFHIHLAQQAKTFTHKRMNMETMKTKVKTFNFSIEKSWQAMKLVSVDLCRLMCHSNWLLYVKSSYGDHWLGLWLWVFACMFVCVYKYGYTYSFKIFFTLICSLPFYELPHFHFSFSLILNSNKWRRAAVRVNF